MVEQLKSNQPTTTSIEANGAIDFPNETDLVESPKPHHDAAYVYAT